MASNFSRKDCAEFDAFAKAETSNALLVIIDGESYWIPKTQIHDDSEVYDMKDGIEGTLIIKQLDCRAKRADMKFIIGVDECGLGSIAGPLVVCAVMAPANWAGVPGLKDSKKLSKNQIDQVATLLRVNRYIKHEECWAVPAAIDSNGIKKAHMDAFKQVVRSLEPFVMDGDDVEVIVDGLNTIETSLPCRAMPKADERVTQVSAASVIGKDLRNHLMADIHKKNKKYEFDQNQGYPTARHLELLRKYGPSPEHRKSYHPVLVLL